MVFGFQFSPLERRIIIGLPTDCVPVVRVSLGPGLRDNLNRLNLNISLFSVRIFDLARYCQKRLHPKLTPQTVHKP